MKRYKFRGKALADFSTSNDGVEKGDWVYGYLSYSYEHSSYVIITRMQAECGGVGSGLVEVSIPVHQATVGQYAGRKDKNGKDIYEGDLLSHKYYSSPVVVTFKDSCFESGDVSFYDKSLERIGSIHDATTQATPEGG